MVVLVNGYILIIFMLGCVEVLYWKLVKVSYNVIFLSIYMLLWFKIYLFVELWILNIRLVWIWLLIFINK